MVCGPLKLNPTNKKSYSLVLVSLVMEKLNFSWGGNEKKDEKSWIRGMKKGSGPQIPTGEELFILKKKKNYQIFCILL